MKYYIEEINNEQCDKVVKNFYFKVHDSKLKNISKFEHQIKKALERIKKNHEVINTDGYLRIRRFQDDFINDRSRLIISVNCAI